MGCEEGGGAEVDWEGFVGLWFEAGGVDEDGAEKEGGEVRGEGGRGWRLEDEGYDVGGAAPGRGDDAWMGGGVETFVFVVVDHGSDAGGGGEVGCTQSVVVYESKGRGRERNGVWEVG